VLVVGQELGTGEGKDVNGDVLGLNDGGKVGFVVGDRLGEFVAKLENIEVVNSNPFLLELVT